MQIHFSVAFFFNLAFGLLLCLPAYATDLLRSLSELRQKSPELYHSVLSRRNVLDLHLRDQKAIRRLKKSGFQEKQTSSDPLGFEVHRATTSTNWTDLNLEFLRTGSSVWISDKQFIELLQEGLSGAISKPERLIRQTAHTTPLVSSKDFRSSSLNDQVTMLVDELNSRQDLQSRTLATQLADAMARRQYILSHFAVSLLPKSDQPFETADEALKLFDASFFKSNTSRVIEELALGLDPDQVKALYNWQKPILQILKKGAKKSSLQSAEHVVTLIEMSPDRAKYRGDLGIDCTPKCSPTYLADSDFSFEMINSKGDSVGYLSFALVKTANQQMTTAYIYGLSGKRISQELTKIALWAIPRIVSRILKTNSDHLILPSVNQTNLLFNYTSPNQEVSKLGQHAKPVEIIFDDEEARTTIAQFGSKPALDPALNRTGRMIKALIFEDLSLHRLDTHLSRTQSHPTRSDAIVIGAEGHLYGQPQQFLERIGSESQTEVSDMLELAATLANKHRLPVAQFEDSIRQKAIEIGVDPSSLIGRSLLLEGYFKSPDLYDTNTINQVIPMFTEIIYGYQITKAVREIWISHHRRIVKDSEFKSRVLNLIELFETDLHKPAYVRDLYQSSPEGMLAFLASESDEVRSLISQKFIDYTHPTNDDSRYLRLRKTVARFRLGIQFNPLGLFEIYHSLIDTSETPSKFERELLEKSLSDYFRISSSNDRLKFKSQIDLKSASTTQIRILVRVLMSVQEDAPELKDPQLLDAAIQLGMHSEAWRLMKSSFWLKDTKKAVRWIQLLTSNQDLLLQSRLHLTKTTSSSYWRDFLLKNPSAYQLLSDQLGDYADIWKVEIFTSRHWRNEPFARDELVKISSSADDRVRKLLIDKSEQSRNRGRKDDANWLRRIASDQNPSKLKERNYACSSLF